MKITSRQANVLTTLEDALILATDSGLLDLLAERAGSEVVNRFCDEIEQLSAEIGVVVAE